MIYLPQKQISLQAKVSELFSLTVAIYHGTYAMTHSCSSQKKHYPELASVAEN